MQIVGRARELLISNLQPEWFLNRFEDLLKRAGIKTAS
jgi:hypothetical protein